MNLKVGDYVLIKKDAVYSHNHPVTEKHKSAVGQIGQISKIVGSIIIVSKLPKKCGISWCYDEQDLQKVKNVAKLKNEVTNND